MSLMVKDFGRGPGARTRARLDRGGHGHAIAALEQVIGQPARLVEEQNGAQWGVTGRDRERHGLRSIGRRLGDLSVPTSTVPAPQ